MRAVVVPLRATLRALNWAVQIAVWCGALLAGAALVAATLLISIEVVARMLGTSTLMADEYSGYMVLSVLGLGMAYVLQRGALLRVDFIYQRFGPRTRRIVGVIYSLLALAFFALLAYRLSIFAMQTYGRGTFAPTPIGTPLFLPQSLVPFGLGLACLELLRQLFIGVAARDAVDDNSMKVLSE